MTIEERQEMNPKHWCHSRRATHAKQDDPFDALITESADAAASGKLLRASRLLRYVEQLRRLRTPRRQPLVIERTPLPSPQPRLNPVRASAPVPHKRAAYSDEEKANLKRLYRLGGIEHLMPPFEE